MADEAEPQVPPQSSAEKEALAASTSNYVYIRSDDYAWIPARVLDMEDEGKRAKVSVPQYRNETAIQSDGGQRASSFETIHVELKDYANNTLLLQNVDEHGQLKEVDDMVDLAFLHEAAILYNLKARHVQGKPYTRTGDIVIACNPYQWLHSLYSTATRRHYANALVWKAGSSLNTLSTLDPHIYEVSAAAYRGLAIDGNDQSILVSGESGAGKTESVKICLHHIASVQQGTAGQQEIDDDSETKATNTASTTSTSPIVQRVLDSNPLLEAFGNAQTVRNDNSSRFGKYIQLQFDVEDPVNAVYAGHTLPSCVLAGSKCEVYLLEKSRVVHHEPEERTYHIFYQLLASDNESKAEIWSGLEDTDQESFCYVGHSELNTIEGLTDKERFQKTVESLSLIGVTGEKKLTLFRSIAIVLQLGNLVVEPDPDDEDGRSIVTSQDELKDLAELMGVESDLLESAFLIRTMRARNEEFKVPLNATQARDSCDAFAKEIYAKTFLWLVRCINDATCAEQNYQSTPVSSSFGTIGLLDIFGFESFETNRFEQLCINYANEKLQQKFTQDIFRSVQNEYEAEGIELGEIKYDDNTDVLDLVESRSGLLAVLNEECVRPGGNDKAFVLKIEQMNKGSPCLVRQKHFDAHEFGVKHYAGEVVYNAEGFVHKNMDTLPADLQECATKSTNTILAHHMNNDTMMNAPGGSSPSGAKKKPAKKAPQKNAGRSLQKKGSALVGQTVWTKFKGQLTALMANLGTTRTRYIRCIKPNTMKQPLVMEHNSTVEQLRCAGVVAAVTISRSAFPNRLEHEIVLDRFKALWRSKAQQREAREKAQEATDDPTAKNKMMADDLLTNAMHDLETKSKEGTLIKAFVMGSTRTYFRAGALEFLEAERLKHLGFWSASIQRIIRGFCKRRIYNRLRTVAIVLQSMFRQRRDTKRYQAKRRAATLLENWVRLVLAKQALITLRRNHNATRIQAMWRMIAIRPAFIKQRKAAVVIQAIGRGAIQRPKYRVALHQYKEDQKLENQVLALQRKLEEAEKRRIDAERMAEEKARKAVEEYREEKKEIESSSPSRSKKEESEKPAEAKLESAVSSGAANAAAAEPDSPAPQPLTAEQQVLIDESGKMLEYMRKEVFKLRGQNAQLRRDFDLLKDNNQRLMDANASAGASFAALNQHAKHLSKVNENLSQENYQIRQAAQKSAVAQTELKEELKMKHATYVAEIHSRIQYQKAMNKVVEIVEQRCRDTRLVEDVLMVADECESNYNNEQAASREGAGGGGSPGGGVFSSSSPNRGAESTIMSSFRSFWS